MSHFCTHCYKARFGVRTPVSSQTLPRDAAGAARRCGRAEGGAVHERTTLCAAPDRPSVGGPIDGLPHGAHCGARQGGEERRRRWVLTLELIAIAHDLTGKGGKGGDKKV